MGAEAESAASAIRAEMKELKLRFDSLQQDFGERVKVFEEELSELKEKVDTERGRGNKYKDHARTLTDNLRVREEENHGFEELLAHFRAMLEGILSDWEDRSRCK